MTLENSGAGEVPLNAQPKSGQKDEWDDFDMELDDVLSIAEGF